MANIKDDFVNFQYQYSKLFVRGFNRKKFEMISTDAGLWAVNNSKNTFIALVSTLFPSFFICSVFIMPFATKNEMPVNVAIVVSVLQTLIGLIVFRQFLWLINGRQELRIENGNLILRKKGTFWTRDKIYSLDQVKNIRQAFDEDHSSTIEKLQRNIIVTRKILLTHVIGEVLFDYKFDAIKVFNDLDNDEKKQLTNEMIRWKSIG